jgi:hypothetical protein
MGRLLAAVIGSAAPLVCACASLSGLSDGPFADAAGDVQGAHDSGEGIDAPANVMTDAPVDVHIDVHDALADAPLDAQAMDTGGNMSGCANGAVCIPPPPAGWALVGYSMNAPVGCPPGYGSAVQTVEGLHAAPATCACSCAVTQPPSCTMGSVNLVEAYDPSCNAMTESLSGSGCVTETFMIPPGAYSSGAPIPPSGGFCGATPSTNVPVATFDGQGAYCTATGSALGGCPAGACYRTPPALACVAQGGDVPCPMSYANKHLVGTGVSDTRGCSACTCAARATCMNPVIRFYTASNCTGLTTDAVINGSCVPVGQGNYGSYQYLVTAVPSCLASAASPSGTAGLSGETTICCL